MYLFMWGCLFLFVKMGVVKVNKIYRIVYNETTHTWVAVNEIAKQNRKSNGSVVDNTTTSVSGRLKKLSILATAVAFVSPFMAENAQADVLCRDNNNSQVFARTGATCNSNETLISNITPPNSTINNNSISIGSQNGTFQASGVKKPGTTGGSRQETPGAHGNSDIAIGTNAAAHGNRISKDGLINNPGSYEFDASGYYSTTTTTKGGKAIAIGNMAQAVREGAIAVGYNAAAGLNAVAIGGDKTRAVTPGSIAIGYGSRIQGQSGVNTSQDDPSNGGNSIALGHEANNFTYSGANLNDWYANTKNSIAIGFKAHTHAANAFAIGVSTDAIAERAFAIGTASTQVTSGHHGSLAAGQGSVVIGDQARSGFYRGGNYSDETSSNIATNDSVAIGTGSLVSARNALALGGGISYTYHDITYDTNGNPVKMDNISKYYFGEAEGWKNEIGSFKQHIGATVGKDSDGAIALGGASADEISGADNDYYPSTVDTKITVTKYVKAAEVNEGAKRAIAIGGGSQIGGTVDLSIYNEIGNYKYTVDDDGNEITLPGILTGATGVNSVAVGTKNRVLGDNSTAVGQGNIVLANNAGAFGDPSVITNSADNSYSVGNNNVIGAEQVFALGNNITNTTSNSVFLGDKAAYVKNTYDVTKEDKGSTADKQTYATNAEDIFYIDENGNLTTIIAVNAKKLTFAGATPVGVVSVGDVGSERRIQNVAAGLIGKDSTDAINGSQLYAVIQKFKPGGTTIINNDVSINAGNNIQVTKNGPNNYTIATTRDINVEGDLNVEGNTTVNNFAINPNSNVDIGGNQIHNVAAGTADTDAVNVGQLRQAIDDVNNHINAVSKQADAAAAAAIAVASMPQSYLPGKNLIAIGGGTYNGQTGYAIGLSTISDNGAWIFKATATGNSKKRFGAGVGAGFLW